jgi:hypothetical protein
MIGGLSFNALGSKKEHHSPRPARGRKVVRGAEARVCADGRGRSRAIDNMDKENSIPSRVRAR